MYLETQCTRYIMYLSNPENFPLKAVVPLPLCCFQCIGLVCVYLSKNTLSH